jgi:hypothetical protein
VPGLYRVPLVEGCKSDKKKKVKVEIEKQWNTGFLEVVKYPQWVSNIVYMIRKAMNVIADHLADHAREDYESLKFDFLDEDVLSVGGREIRLVDYVL